MRVGILGTIAWRVTLKTTFSLVLLFSGWSNVLGSSCEHFSACQAYTRATAVFVGRVLDSKREGDGSSFFHNTIVRFAPERSFKGEVSSIETITFQPDICSERSLIVGETYLVYRDSDGFVRSSNRTHKISADGPNDLDYLRSMSTTSPVFSIRVKIRDLTPAEREKTKVTVSIGNRRYAAKAADAETFVLTVNKPGAYRVEIRLPFVASNLEIGSPSFGHEAHSKVADYVTSLTYQLKFVPNGCDESELRFSRTRE